MGHFPIAQTGMVILTRVFIGKPAIVQQKHIHSQMLGFLHQFGKYLLIEIETCIFPVIQKSQTAAFTIFQAIVACPFVQIATALRGTIIT